MLIIPTGWWISSLRFGNCEREIHESHVRKNGHSYEQHDFDFVNILLFVPGKSFFLKVEILTRRKNVKWVRVIFFYSVSHTKERKSKKDANWFSACFICRTSKYEGAWECYPSIYRLRRVSNLRLKSRTGLKLHLCLEVLFLVPAPL